jgi:hypothetical protein
MTASLLAGPGPLDRDQRRWIAAGLFVVALLLRLACFTGLIASDDLTYAHHAQLISRGEFTPHATHWATRYGVLLPVALLYKLAGVSEWSTIALALVASAASVPLLWLIASRLCGPTAALVAALLLATAPMELRYATVLVPEPVLGLYILLAVLVYVRMTREPAMAMGALCGALIGLAYLAKEPSVFVAPAMAADAALGRRWRHAAAIVIGVCSVVVLEQGFYYASTGDPLFRLHAMARFNKEIPAASRAIAAFAPTVTTTGGGAAAAGSPDGVIANAAVTASTGAVADAANADFDDAEADPDVANTASGDPDAMARRLLIRRLFKRYPDKMLVPGRDFGVHSLVALVLSALACVRYRRDGRLRFLLLWAWLPWLYLNFGSSSLTYYAQIPPAARYISLTYPPLFVLAGWLVAELLSTSAWTRRLAVSAVTAVFISGMVWGVSTRATGYRTDQVAILRIIAGTVEATGVRSVCFEGDPRQTARWHRTMVVLSGGDLPACDSRSGVTVRADGFGNPTVVSRTAAASP